MGRRAKRERLWIWIPVVVVILAVSGVAVNRSTTIRASWRVLPYQTLRLSDSLDEVSAVAYQVPSPTPLDYARGYIETEHAVRLHVVSNTPWKIQVRVRDPAIALSSDMRLRNHGGEYFTPSIDPQILARGLNGVYEISIDYRMLIGLDGEFSSQPPLEIVYTIMSD